MADIITRCPKCATAFRITDALLKPPKGRVRCGACLHVFNAVEHVVKAQSPEPPANTEQKPVAQPERDTDDDEVPEDESWALELLKDDDDEPSVKFRKIVTVNEAPPPAAPAEPQRAHGNDALLDELDALLTTVPEEEHTGHGPASQSEPGPQSSGRAESRTTLSKAEQLSLEEMIAAIEPEALEVEWQPKVPAWRRRILWPTLAALALLALVVQIAWLEFPRLSRVEPYRSFYAAACSVFGCQIPELRDRSQIQTSNLLVRSHPRKKGSLLVDVILHNNATFEQPFPGLQLTFSDSRDQAVAVHRFSPSDYLGGELAGRDNMPVSNPIHIAFEVTDPGGSAVSYSIAIID